MLTRLLLAVLNAIIVLIVLYVIVLILTMVGLSQFGAILTPFVVLIAILVGILTFLGAIPNYWNNIFK